MTEQDGRTSVGPIRSIDQDLAVVRALDAVPTILEVICRSTGLGFSAVARVTEQRWVACAVRDQVGFGLEPGGELRVETTICHEIRQTHRMVVIDHVEQDARFCGHPTPARYGFQSYISVPIVLEDGRMFGTLCALDARPALLNRPEVVGMFTLFAELIALHIDAHARVDDLQGQVAARTTELRRSNEELQRQIAISDHDRRALRTLTDNLERTRESQRAAIARELHDELGQALTALKLDLDSTRKALEEDGGTSFAKLVPMIGRMDALVDSALDGTERIVAELRPAILDTLGCPDAAEWLVGEFRKRHAIDTRFIRHPRIAVAGEAGTALFRILQEALTNVARHAGASRVEVELGAGAGGVQLRVTDNGRGMRDRDRDKPTSFGLKGMTERVRALGGSMRLGVPAGGGTELYVTLPTGPH